MIGSSGNIKDRSQYYQEILYSLPNIIYVLDENCALTECNSNFLKLFGLKQLDDVGKNPYRQLVNLAHWSEERVGLLKQNDINSLLSGETSVDKEEPPILDQKNNVFYFNVTRIPLFDKEKTVIGLLVVLVDISEHKKMAEQIEKLKEQLQLNNAKAPTPASSPVMAAEKLPKILMVEDNTVARKSAQSLLMQLDCQVDVADSGDKAASLFKPGKYDLVFMDIGLEDTSGYVVSKKIRQMEKDTQFHVPIIALTGFEADVVKYDCDEFYMEGAVTKPLTAEQAKQIIQHYVYNIDIPVRGLKSLKG